MPKIAMEDVGSKLPIIKLKIKGKEYYFVLDTGADGVMVSNEIVPDSVPVTGHSLNVGVGGHGVAESKEVRLALFGVVIREVTIDNRLATMMSRIYGKKFGGLLGNDLLNKFSSVTFDYKKRVIEFKL